MTLRDLAGRLDRAQRTRGFKLASTGALLLVSLVLIVGAIVNANLPPGAVAATDPAEAVAPGETIANSDAAQRLLSGVLDRASSPAGFIVAVAVALGLCLVIIWLGVGLSYLGLLLASAAVIAPLAAFPAGRPYATIAGGASLLTAAFTAMLQGMRWVFGGKGPVSAVARNVLAEAVRMKLSMLFIVLLIMGLSLLPMLLDAEEPLRYRVQFFLQYGTGGTFWIIALLVVAFSVSTVAVEQRDKVIWQTVTKPVAPWQYLLGKWLGVSGLAALLLLVNATGIFLFVEYLRNQPAIGEREAFVALAAQAVSEDRLILENQILTSRRTVYVTEPPIDRTIIDSIIAERVREVQARDPTYLLSPTDESEMREQILKQARLMYFRIEPGEAEEYAFESLDLPEDSDVPVTLSYRFDAGSNRPDQQYKVSISVAGASPLVREAGLGHTHSVPLTPAILLPSRPGVPFPVLVAADSAEFGAITDAVARGLIGGAEILNAGKLIDDRGTLTVQFANGEIVPGQDQAGNFGLGILPNADPLQFPPGSLSVSYPVGSYHINFAKAVLVLWLKLAFLAMLGITASTFLSFSVATLMAIGVFLIAESAPFIKDSLEVYATIDSDKDINFFRVAVSAIAHAVSWIFLTYGELSPVRRLVAGENVSLLSVVKGLTLLALWTGALFLIAVQVFRRRELAIYSGN